MSLHEESFRAVVKGISTLGSRGKKQYVIKQSQIYNMKKVVLIFFFCRGILTMF